MIFIFAVAVIKPAVNFDHIMTLDRAARVKRKRRRRTLLKKIAQLSALFEMDVLIVTRDKQTRQEELLRSSSDAHWPLWLDTTVSGSSKSSQDKLLMR